MIRLQDIADMAGMSSLQNLKFLQNLKVRENKESVTVRYI